MANFLTEDFLGMDYWIWIVIVIIIIFLIRYAQYKKSTPSSSGSASKILSKGQIIEKITSAAKEKVRLGNSLIKISNEKSHALHAHDKALAFVSFMTNKDPANIWTDEVRQRLIEEDKEILEFIDNEKKFVSALYELNKLETGIYSQLDDWEKTLKSLNINPGNLINELRELLVHKPVTSEDPGILWYIRICHNYAKHSGGYALSIDDLLKEEKLNDLLTSRFSGLKTDVEALKKNIEAERTTALKMVQKLKIQVSKLKELLSKLQATSNDSEDENPIHPSPTVHPKWPQEDGKHDPTPPKDPKLPIEPTIEPQPKPQPTKLTKVFVDLSPWFMPIKNQNGSCACAAFAGASILEYMRNTNNVDIQTVLGKTPQEFQPSTELSELFLWYNLRPDNEKGLNTGANMHDIPKSILNYGDCFEKLWPWLPLDNLDIPTNFAKHPGTAQYEDASMKRIKGYRDIPFNPDSWAEELLKGNPILIGINVGVDFTKAALSKEKLLWKLENKWSGGHAVVIVGFTTNFADPNDPKSQIPAFKIRNSWGKDWAENGYLWISYDLLPQILITRPVILEGLNTKKKGGTGDVFELRFNDSAHVLRLKPKHSSPKDEIKIISSFHDPKNKGSGFKIGKQKAERVQHVVLLDTEISEEIQALIYFYSDGNGNGKFKISTTSPQSPTVIKFNGNSVNWTRTGETTLEFRGFIREDIKTISINEYDFDVNVSKEVVQQISLEEYKKSFSNTKLRLDREQKENGKKNIHILTLVPKNNSPKNEIKILAKFHTVHRNNASESGVNDTLTIGKPANYKTQFIALKDTKIDDQIQARIAFFPKENKFRAFSIGDTKIKINGGPRMSDINQFNSNAWIEENTKTLSINEYEFYVRLSMEKDHQINTNDYTKTFNNAILSLDEEEPTKKEYDPVTNLEIHPIETSNQGKSFRVIGASVHGESHIQRQVPNQDAIIAVTSKGGYGPPIILAVADGVSTCARGDVASQTAVVYAAEALIHALELKNKGADLQKIIGEVKYSIHTGFYIAISGHIQKNPLTKEELQSYYSKWRTGDQIKKYVRRDLNNPYAAYGTTLMAVLVTEEFTLYLKVGDGRIVTVSGDKINIPIKEPEIADVATEVIDVSQNVKHISPSDVKYFKIAIDKSKPEFIMVTTDGLPDCFPDGGNEAFLDVANEIRAKGADFGQKYIVDLLKMTAITNKNAKKDDCTIGIIHNLEYKPEK